MNFVRLFKLAILSLSLIFSSTGAFALDCSCNSDGWLLARVHSDDVGQIISFASNFSRCEQVRQGSTICKPNVNTGRVCGTGDAGSGLSRLSVVHTYRTPDGAESPASAYDNLGFVGGLAKCIAYSNSGSYSNQVRPARCLVARNGNCFSLTVEGRGSASYCDSLFTQTNRASMQEAATLQGCNL